MRILFIHLYVTPPALVGTDWYNDLYTLPRPETIPSL